MKKEQNDVKEFMAAACQDCPDIPTPQDFPTRELRVRLLLEEVLELADALGIAVVNNDGATVEMDGLAFMNNFEPVNLVEVADALTDIEYVNQGAACAFGIDLEPCWDEVQRSNMSKFIDGHRDEKTGKWIKGPSYSPAKLAPIIMKQLENGRRT